VALAVPEIDSPYFAELAGHVATAAEKHGWTLLIDQTGGDADRERLVTEGFRSQLIDGLIFSPIASGHAELAHRQDDTPMVLLGERVFDGPTDHVSIDNVAASITAVDHLLRLGRRRVAAIGRQHRPQAGTARLRLGGYERALAGHGLAVDEALVADTDSWRRPDGAEAMAALLRLPEPPDAVFCFNDLLALGALRTLHDAGVRVPDQVAVVGFDDVEDGRYSAPSLTTVRPDKERIAILAVELLAERLDAVPARGGDAPTVQARELLAPYDLAVRESTAGRRR
jgi:DNA-binding LacI/PurR family transcriptional regulator